MRVNNRTVETVNELGLGKAGNDTSEMASHRKCLLHGISVSPPLLQLYMNSDIVTFTEVSKDPKGMEWLWNPQIIGVYNRLLQRCELNKHTTEAASGALQNITAGDRRVRLSTWNVVEAQWNFFSAVCFAWIGPEQWLL